MAKNTSTSRSTKKKDSEPDSNEQYVRVRVKALEMPPVKDGIVIGKAAPMGAEAMLRTLKLMSAERFVHLQIPNGEIISDAIVREAVLRKLKEDRIRAFILKRIKPLMADNELLLLDMDIEVVVENTL